MLKKHFLVNGVSFQSRGACYVHPTFLCIMTVYCWFTTKKTIDNWGLIVQISPREDHGELRTFSENCILTSNIGGNKVKTQKIMVPTFPQNRSEPCRGSPRTPHRFWFIYPVSITFCPFLSSAPRGHFDPFWTNWIFENLEKNVKG